MTLLMRDLENVEKGMKKGLQKGKIFGAISMCRDLDLPEKIILKKIQDKFHLTAEEAKKIYRQFNMSFLVEQISCLKNHVATARFHPCSSHILFMILI